MSAASVNPTGQAAAPVAAAICCRDLSVRRGARLVLRDVNLRVAADESLCLIGPNGSGKTTLLLAMLGLLRPERGLVELVEARPGQHGPQPPPHEPKGVAIQHVAARVRARAIAYVPQLLDYLPEFRVYDVVAGGRYAHVPPLRPLSRADHEHITDALRRTGLLALADRPIAAVSGGERQKVLIAAALAQDAQWMLLDEPNTGLDPAYQIELVHLLRGWHARGRGLVLVSHDLQLPAALGGRVVALRDGAVAADDAASSVLTAERLGAIYSARFEVATTRAGRSLVLPDWWA